jgi:hypothetical protein
MHRRAHAYHRSRMADDDELATARVVHLPRRLEAAPRAVPRTLWLALCFGGPAGWFGWTLASVGLVLCAAAIPARAPAYDRTAPAAITSVDEVRGRRGYTHYDVHYAFTDEAGARHAGVVRVDDRTDAPAAPVAKYVAAHPDEFALEHLEPPPLGASIWLLLLAPLAGLAIALHGLRTGARAYRLLRRGIETRGTRVETAPGLAAVNGERSLRLTFEYETGGGERHRTVVKTRNARPLMDEPTEAMLYDPGRPWLATPLDHLPGRPRIVDGKLTSWRVWWGWPSTALPLVSLAALAVLIARLAR